MKLTVGQLVAVQSIGLFAGSFAEAQQPGQTFRVGLVFVATPVSQMAGPEPAHPSVRAFLHEMRRLGHVEGRNLIFERRSAEGRADRFDAILADLFHLEMDVIVTAGADLPRKRRSG